MRATIRLCIAEMYRSVGQDMDKKRLKIATRTLEAVAMKEGVTVSEVKKEIQKAMLIGLCSQDPAVQAHWAKIPREGEVPTPEEVILFLTEQFAQGNTI